jgi:hypothetical protein
MCAGYTPPADAVKITKSAIAQQLRASYAIAPGS